MRANLGVDIENLIVSQPDYGEQALEIAQALVTPQALMSSWSIRWPR